MVWRPSKLKIKSHRSVVDISMARRWYPARSSSPKFVPPLRLAAIRARTDAGAVIHFKEAIGRANLAIAAGADIAFVEAVPTFEEMAAVPQSVRGPCLLNIVPGGKTPPVPLADAQAMGYRLAILPGLLLREVIVSIERVLKTVIETKVQPVRPVDATLLNSLRQLFHADEWDALRQAHDPPVTAGDQ
jgi:2-methylisocitrate lyase-like PEP mutase family enzyme